MKVRRGFVSNSSSTSFMVQIPNDLDVSDPWKLRHVLFPIDSCIVSYYEREATDPDREWSTDVLAHIIFAQMMAQTPKTHDEANRWLSEGHAVFPLLPQGARYYEFNFADDEGDPWGTLEHSDVFRRLECRAESNH